MAVPAATSRPASATPTPDPSAEAIATPTVAPPIAQAPPLPAHFRTVGAGVALPSGAQCALWVRSSPLPENKGANRAANQVTGQHVGSDLFSGDDAAANQILAPRIDGQFTGTTHEILRWAACKWGIDEDIVAAQAAVESGWLQSALGDFGSDPSACPPGYGVGADGTCPQSFGVLQDRYPYEQSTWPGIARSTAMNADTAYGIWRTCFDGYEGWLNTVDRGAQYAPGDAWGCVGRWFSGRWYTQPATEYIATVRDYLSRRVWEQAIFQEP